MDIDPDGKLLRRSLEIGMTREEAEEWLRYVEAAGDVDAVHIARAMPLAFLCAKRRPSDVIRPSTLRVSSNTTKPALSLRYCSGIP
jgi:hypothetical protein